jgi:DNA-binding transcriptional LysR family regulator
LINLFDGEPAMDLRHLRYFLALAEEGHFGRAAERLHIVQPALSMQIRALEEELGGALFVRTSRRVELTEAGVLLRDEASRTLELAAHAKETVQRALRGETGRVRVAYAGIAVFSGKLMGDLRAFRAAYPDAELVVQEMAPQLQADAIGAGLLDVGYAPGHGVNKGDDLISVPVGAWRMVVALHRDHPLAARKRLKARMLVGEPLILYAAGEDDESVLAPLRAAMGSEPTIAHRAANTLTVLALAASGLGFAVVPDPLRQVAVPELVFVPLDETSLRADLLLTGRLTETNGAVKAFVALSRSLSLQTRNAHSNL